MLAMKKAGLLIIVFGCTLVTEAQDMRRQLQAQFIESPDGAVIEIPEGRFPAQYGIVDGREK